MGALGGPLGLSGGAAGTGFDAPSNANIQGTISAPQVGQAYDQSQNSLQQQQALLNALQGQGGLQKQNEVYNQSQGLAGQMANANGVQNLSNAIGGLQGVANGTGPNPAIAALNQATGQNVANQAALMAGQRGAGANVGLIARQAAMQGANTQQQAAGQAATMQAQQSLNALGQIGGLSSNQVAQQQAQQQALSGMANTQAANQIGQTGANVTANQAQYGNAANAMNALNQNQVAMQGNINSNNAALANTQLQAGHAIGGSMMNSAGGMMSMIPMGAEGGEVVGEEQPLQPQPMQQPLQPQGAASSFGQFLTGVTSGSAPSVPGAGSVTDAAAGTWAQGSNKGGGGGSSGGGGGMSSMMGKMGGGGGGMSKGGLVDVMVSPGEKIVSPEKAQSVAKGGKVDGKKVPGKAEAKGDSLKNDKVHAKLEPGTIVVKRTRADNDPEGFVRAVLAKRGRK